MKMFTKKVPRAAICTLGCKVNQYESEAISEALQKAGFALTRFEDEAEVYIINTCTVTAESDRKAGQMIRRAAKRAHKPLVLVTGCMAQTQAERVAAIEGVSAVFGSRNKLDCVRFAREAIFDGVLPTMPHIAVYDTEALPIEPMSICRSGGERTRAYIKIEDGCENHCSYCAIPLARGNVVSKEPKDVLSEMERLLANGYREIVLTGIEIASYGKDFSKERNYGLIDLLEEADRLPGLSRLRLGSLEPTYMKPDVVQRMKALEHLAHHFHLSLQSGADAVLRGMKRKYNMSMIRAVMADIRLAMPDVMFTTDIMTGFPGETLSDHAETLSFAKEARLLHIHVFPYSERKNTVAAQMPNRLPTAEKNRRAGELIAVQNEVSNSIYEEITAEAPCLEILSEVCENGIVKGHTANFLEVCALCDHDIPQGTLLCIKVEKHCNGVLLGAIVK